MANRLLRSVFTPGRLAGILGIATIACAAIIASFSIGQQRADPQYGSRAARLGFVREIVEMADSAKAALRNYEATQRPEDKTVFLQACDAMAEKVSHLRQAEHMSEEQSDQIVDLCVSIRQQLSRLGASPADRMTEAGALLDRIRRVVLGFAMDEMRQQDEKLAEQSSAAAFSRRMTVGMAGIEILMVAGIILLVVRLNRLEHLAAVCGGSHRLLYEGQWVSLERYLEKRFGICTADGITNEQAAKLMAEDEVNGRELLRLIEFEKMAAVRAREANKAIHSVRNHLTAVLCFSEMAGAGDAEAQRDMATRVVTHANTISSEVDLLHNAVRSFNPPRNLRVVRDPAAERSVA